jgi:hypothetical protein
MRLRYWAAGAAAAGLLIAGCSTSPEEAAEETAADNSALCQSLQALEAQFAQVKAGAASAATSSEEVTVGDAQAALDQIQQGWEQVKDDAADLSDSVKQQMDMAVSDYQDSLADIGSDESLTSAAADVKTSQNNLKQAYQEISSQLGC